MGKRVEEGEASGSPPTRRESDVAAWHRRSGLPDNVTEDGECVRAAPGATLQAEKAELRAAVARLSEDPEPIRRGLARLAASYLLAGDVETARRYLRQAEHRLTGAADACQPDTAN